jgi:pimeloyl-[acyl-carrier protein] synthase
MAGFDFDPRSPAFRADPYPYYDMLRAYAPIFHWEAWDIWFLTRHEDCATLLRDNRLGHGAFYDVPEQQRPLLEMQSQWLLLKNPPDHTRLRGLVHKAFTPRIVEQMRTKIQAIADGLLDKVQGTGRMDVIADLAYPLPVTVIAEMLGVPLADQEEFHGWSNDLARSLDLTDETAVYDRAAEASVLFRDYLRGLAAEKRAHPHDDLLSILVQVEEAGDRLTEDELYATCTLLFIAGHETTINLIGNGVLALLQHPDQLEKLQADKNLMRTAVEEFLRYDSPVQLTSRAALEEITLRGQTIPRGSQVAFLLGAANRDPERFDNPNSLDIGREPNPHLAFGGGIHYCLGAPLARLEGHIALETLLRRMPNLTPATDAPVYRNNYALRGLDSLPVTWQK